MSATNTWSMRETNDMRHAWHEARRYENKYGEFKTYVECEGVIADALMDHVGDDTHEGDIFWEMVQYAASAFYAGEKV